MQFYALFQVFSRQRNDFLALLFGLFILFCFLLKALNKVSKFEVHMIEPQKGELLLTLNF